MEEATQVFTDRQMDKENVVCVCVCVCVYNGILPSYKKMKYCHLQQHGWT